MRLEVALIADDKARPVTTLQYISSSTGKAQPRFIGRIELRPKIDLSRYSCIAVMDLVELKVVLKKTTQWMWVKREVDAALGGNCFADSVPTLTPSRTFIVRVQEPTMIGLRCLARALNTKFGIESGPTITELEVSVDFKPKKPDQTARDLMFGVLVRHHLPECDLFGSLMSRPRFAVSSGAGSIKHVFRDSPAVRGQFEEFFWTTKRDRQVVVDATYYVGAKDAPVQWSTMDKVKDKQNIAAGTFTELGEDEKRTRIEVTLRGEALTGLGINTLEDLSSLDFRGLQKKFFNFKLATFETRPLGKRKAVSEAIERFRAEKFLVTGVIGLTGQDAVRMRFRKANRPALLQHLHQQGKKVKSADRRGSGVSGTTLAFAELNKAVETALRHLGERVSK